VILVDGKRIPVWPPSSVTGRCPSDCEALL
jgi:hypothetical protein